MVRALARILTKKLGGIARDRLAHANHACGVPPRRLDAVAESPSVVRTSAPRRGHRRRTRRAVAERASSIRHTNRSKPRREVRAVAVGGPRGPPSASASGNIEPHDDGALDARARGKFFVSRGIREERLGGTSSSTRATSDSRTKDRSFASSARAPTRRPRTPTRGRDRRRRLQRARRPANATKPRAPVRRTTRAPSRRVRPRRRSVHPRLRPTRASPSTPPSFPRSPRAPIASLAFAAAAASRFVASSTLPLRPTRRRAPRPRAAGATGSRGARARTVPRRVAKGASGSLEGGGREGRARCASRHSLFGNREATRRLRGGGDTSYTRGLRGGGDLRLVILAALRRRTRRLRGGPRHLRHLRRRLFLLRRRRVTVRPAARSVAALRPPIGPSEDVVRRNLTLRRLPAANLRGGGPSATGDALLSFPLARSPPFPFPTAPRTSPRSRTRPSPARRTDDTRPNRPSGRSTARAIPARAASPSTRETPSRTSTTRVRPPPSSWCLSGEAPRTTESKGTTGRPVSPFARGSPRRRARLRRSRLRVYVRTRLSLRLGLRPCRPSPHLGVVERDVRARVLLSATENAADGSVELGDALGIGRDRVDGVNVGERAFLSFPPERR